MNETFTPGPWHVKPPTDVMHAVCRLSGSIIADVGYSRTLEENDANARLIAAAPDLLEALKRCRFDSFNMTLDDLKFCRAAVAKATGA